jgi:hypothetical protein
MRTALLFESHACFPAGLQDPPEPFYEKICPPPRESQLLS